MLQSSRASLYAHVHAFLSMESSFPYIDPFLKGLYGFGIFSTSLGSIIYYLCLFF